MIKEGEYVKSVVVLGRVTVFGGETVVDGDNNGGEFASKGAANGVVKEGRSAEKGKAATVEEDDDGKGISESSRGGHEETKPEIARGIDHVV